MRRAKFTQAWKQRVRRWLDAWRRAFEQLPAGQVLPDSPYPDYVACPHCSEPEVEVWCYETLARCHNCGRTFAHALPPGCDPACAEKDQTPGD